MTRYYDHCERLAIALAQNMRRELRDRPMPCPPGKTCNLNGAVGPVCDECLAEAYFDDPLYVAVDPLLRMVGERARDNFDDRIQEMEPIPAGLTGRRGGEESR